MGAEIPMAEVETQVGIFNNRTGGCRVIDAVRYRSPHPTRLFLLNKTPAMK